jgi:hypothetical protein
MRRKYFENTLDRYFHGIRPTYSVQNNTSCSSAQLSAHTVFFPYDRSIELCNGRYSLELVANVVVTNHGFYEERKTRFSFQTRRWSHDLHDFPSRPEPVQMSIKRTNRRYLTLLFWLERFGILESACGFFQVAIAYTDFHMLPKGTGCKRK